MLNVRPEDFLGEIFSFLNKIYDVNKKLFANLTELQNLFPESKLLDYEDSDERGILFSYPMYRSIYYKTGSIKHKEAPNEGSINFYFYYRKIKNLPKIYFRVDFKYKHQILFYVGFEFDYGVYSNKDIEYGLVLNTYERFLKKCVKSIYKTINSFKDYYYTISLPYDTTKHIDIDTPNVQCISKSKRDILVTIK